LKRGGEGLREVEDRFRWNERRRLRDPESQGDDEVEGHEHCEGEKEGDEGSQRGFEAREGERKKEEGTN